MKSQSQFSGQMTARQFADALRKRPGTTANIEAAARQVLVTGIALQASAKAYGLTKQRLYKVLKELVAGSEKAHWVTRTISLPPEFIPQLDELLRQGEDFHRTQQAGHLDDFGVSA